MAPKPRKGAQAPDRATPSVSVSGSSVDVSVNLDGIEGRPSSTGKSRILAYLPWSEVTLSDGSIVKVTTTVRRDA